MMSKGTYTMRKAMIRWAVPLLAAAFITVPLHAGDMLLTAGSVIAAPGGAVDVPLEVKDAKGLGSLQFDVKYDPVMLVPTDEPVKAGTDLPGAMIESNVVSPGTLRIALISGEPVNGAGQLLTIGFNVSAEATGKSAIALAGLQAWDHEENLQMLAMGMNGTVDVQRKMSMMVIAAIAGVVLVLLFVRILAAKSRRRRT